MSASSCRSNCRQRANDVTCARESVCNSRLPACNRRATLHDGITFDKDRIDRHRSWAHTASIKGIFQSKSIYEELRERYPRPPSRKSAKAANCTHWDKRGHPWATWLVFGVFCSVRLRTVVMAVYPEGSLNVELVKRYRQVLARKGIDVKLAP
jgi:hypothetical protein